MLFIPTHPRPFLHEHLWRNSPEFWCCNSITESSSLRISPCVRSPHPPHEEPSVWEATGQVVLNQHFKAAPLSIIRGWAASSLLTWVSLGYEDVRSTCATSGWHHPPRESFGRRARRKKTTQRNFISASSISHFSRGFAAKILVAMKDYPTVTLGGIHV